LSQAKFPALIAGIGTGKTLCLLVKMFDYCEKYPNTTALIVRKEFTDLKDSTMRDFEKYFEVKVGSDKNYNFPNGSKLMFRHADEIEVLKNINLGIAGIEQAEEFLDDTQFQFIRDRLRQENGADIRPLCIIANANGHNWIWKYWINNPPSAEYFAVTANTFDNQHNLPKDFIEDLKRMETEAPTHYKQYIMNSFEETSQDDFVFTFQELAESRKMECLFHEGYGLRVAGFDIARYGNDKCACVCIQQMGAMKWKVIHAEQWEHKDLNYTSGRILNLSQRLCTAGDIIDEDGIGAGPLDSLNKGRGLNYRGFRNIPISFDKNKFYANNRTIGAFKIKDLLLKQQLCLDDEELCSELATLKFTYDNHQRRILVSKEQMRKEGIKSPNLADALIMAVSLLDDTSIVRAHYGYIMQPQYSKEDSLFKIGGIR
jgi:hypothetical protein